jgi:hypothetical protein
MRRRVGLISLVCLLAGSASAQDQGYVRVAHCKNEAGFAEVYLPGAVVSRRGAEHVRLDGKTVTGFLAFDFTPVGKNKTMEPVRIGMTSGNAALLVEFHTRGGARATIPVPGGKVAFPQRLAEEMTCGPLNAD